MPDFEKDWKPSLPDAKPSQLTGRLNQLRSTLRVQDPGLVAGRSGSSTLTVDPGRVELHLLFWNDVCILPFPELTCRNSSGESLSDFQQALLLYYLVTADGASLTGRWVSFAELPDGRMYDAAFQGYSGDVVAKRFGLNLDAFKSACSNAGGIFIEIGSASFIFQPLPRVPLMATYWLGDDDFPSSCKILFDESASHYLPIDACAILGSMLTHTLVHHESG